MESIGAGDIALVSTFAWFEGLFSYSAVLPSIMTIGTFVDSTDKITMIRQGEVVGTLVNLAFGAMLGWLTGSWLPLLLVSAASAVMLAVYEYALRQSPAWKGEGA